MLGSQASFCIFEPIAFSLGFDDVATVCQSIEGGAGETLVAKDFRPILKWQVCGDDDAVAIPGIGDGLTEFTFVMNIYPTVDQVPLSFSGGINTDSWGGVIH